MSALPQAQVTSVAKSPLFTTPVVGWFLKVMRAVPVAHATTVCTPAERKQMNADMFETAIRRIRDERVKICIFPEGTCHTSPDIKELKTGTARMALQVAASTGGRVRPPIVPVGLNYSAPSAQRFRGSALVDFGRPIEITDEPVPPLVYGFYGFDCLCVLDKQPQHD